MVAKNILTVAESTEEIESENDYIASHNSCKDQDLHVGEGLWRWLKPAEPIELRVEDLYEQTSEDFWYIIDDLLRDRKDLQERIAKYKQKRRKSNG